MTTDVIVGQYFCESPMTEHALRDVKRISGDRVVLEAVLQDVDVLNRNKRKYRKSAIQQAIDGPYIQEKLKTNSLLGEANHPDPNAPLSRRMQIDLNNVSHVIKQLSWDGNLLIGRVESAGTTVGRNFAGLILENGMQASFSMRGAGSFKQEKGYIDVTGPLDIRTWDAVQFPSHASAYARSSLSEDVVTDIRASELAAYIAEEADKKGYIAEEVFGFAREQMEFAIKDGKVLISEKVTKKPLGWHSLTNALQEEFNSEFAKLFK